MHALPPVPLRGRRSLKTTLYKKRPFLFLFTFFLETKLYMWTVLSVWSCLFLVSEQCNLLAMMFSGCNNILDIMVSYHAELPMESGILIVCDKICSRADQNLTEIESYKGWEKTKL